jgi:hypothetical protein
MSRPKIEAHVLTPEMLARMLGGESATTTDTPEQRIAAIRARMDAAAAMAMTDAGMAESTREALAGLRALIANTFTGWHALPSAAREPFLRAVALASLAEGEGPFGIMDKLITTDMLPVLAQIAHTVARAYEPAAAVPAPSTSLDPDAAERKRRGNNGGYV